MIEMKKHLLKCGKQSVVVIGTSSLMVLIMISIQLCHFRSENAYNTSQVLQGFDISDAQRIADPNKLFLLTVNKAGSLESGNAFYSDTQWYIDNPGFYLSLSASYPRKVTSGIGIDLDVVRAWSTMEESGAAKREVVVAVIDTGVDYQHPDLADHMWVNKGEIAGDNIDNDKNGYVDDIYGWDFYNGDASVCHYDSNGTDRTASSSDNDDHGTHIAGIIAAAANDTGISGIASNINVKIMSLKINGGTDGSGMISNAIAAVKYAEMMGADICNLSWGTSIYSDDLYEVMKESDMLFVAAVGNSGKNNDDKPIYPASLKLDNLISVTSIDAWGSLNYYSDYGPETVDLAAPGNDIYSTTVGNYKSMSGSSMAAPQVTAVAAMLYASSDHLFASNVKQLILDHIKPLSDLEGKVKYAGIPDAYQAVSAISDLIPDTQTPQMSLSTTYSKKQMEVHVNATDSGASGIRVIKWIAGKKTGEDFQHGINGTLVEDNKIVFSKAGSYTFYISDYAGNEAVQTYKVLADTTAPQLSLSYKVAADYKTRTIAVKVSDGQSGLKRIKYMYGIKKASDFLPENAGTKISTKDGKGSFIVQKDGIYTVFVSDNSGNVSVKTINVKTVKASVNILMKKYG